MAHVPAVVQVLAEILIPYTLAVGIDERPGGAVRTVGVNDDGRTLRTAALDVQKLVLKDRAALQIHLRAGTKFHGVDLM